MAAKMLISIETIEDFLNDSENISLQEFGWDEFTNKCQFSVRINNDLEYHDDRYVNVEDYVALQQLVEELEVTVKQQAIHIQEQAQTIIKYATIEANKKKAWWQFSK